MSDNEEPCEECDGKKWLHMGEPFEIQRCDACSDDDDSNAVELHRKDCGCDWPEVDYQNLIWRFIGDDRRLPKELSAAIDRFKSSAAQRPMFILNVGHLIALLGEILELYYKSWDELGGRESSLFSNIQGTACALATVMSLAERGLWKPHWVWYPDDGVFIDGKWKAQNPALEDPSNDIFMQVVRAHLPKLQAALKKPRFNPKLIHAALTAAKSGLASEDYQHHLLPQLEEAMRHFLEFHPDASVPDKQEGETHP